MQLINGRTSDQWAAFDRGKLIGAAAIALLLLVIWIAGYGPGRASVCCGLSSGASASVPPAVAPEAPAKAPEAVATVPETPALAAPTPDPACADALDTEVLFASNSAELAAEWRATLDRLAPCWRGGRFEVSGHTDSVGNPRANEALGLKRAEAVKRYLYETHQVPLHKINVISYGPDKPIAPNTTRDGRAKNRRVVIKVLI